MEELNGIEALGTASAPPPPILSLQARCSCSCRGPPPPFLFGRGARARTDLLRHDEEPPQQLPPNALLVPAASSELPRGRSPACLKHAFHVVVRCLACFLHSSCEFCQPRRETWAGAVEVGRLVWPNFGGRLVSHLSGIFLSGTISSLLDAETNMYKSGIALSRPVRSLEPMLPKLTVLIGLHFDNDKLSQHYEHLQFTRRRFGRGSGEDWVGF